MIDYERYCQIRDYHDHRHLTVTQIARELHLDTRTVARWVAAEKFRPRRVSPKPSKLDPYKPQIVRWLENHPYTATQIFLRLREAGYTGGITIVKDYVHRIRPPRTPAFLTLSFAPGECAQVDWGQFGSIAVGNTRRRLSFFVMVLCYSRMLYVEFTVSETMEHFLACHANAFAFFGGVPERVMVDNLRSAVLRHALGQAPVLNPRYKDFADHFGFTVRACGVGQAHEKGRVENAVGYVKKNFLAGLELSDFALVNPAARQWLETVANVRIHGSTHRPPAELFQTEKPRLKPLSLRPYDVGVIQSVRANSQFRVRVDTNTYSVPAEYAGAALTLKLYPDHLCLYHQDKLIARHVRCYDRRRDFEDPDHPRALLQQRRRARDQKLLQRLLSLTPKAERFYQGLAERRLNVLHHVRQIVALAEIYGSDKTARAIEDALEFQAFSCEYIANLLEQRQRILPEPGALHLTRRQDLLDLELPEPNLWLYDTHETSPAPPTQATPEASPRREPDADVISDSAAGGDGPNPIPGENHEPPQDLCRESG
ncbi:MAG TPA: IS21 family transposase [Phycisphaerae bacterium]|nr:IS21 family transposase [Phycisphaerae bacterium]